MIIDGISYKDAWEIAQTAGEGLVKVADGLIADNTRMRGLLVEIHEVVVGEPMQCPSCGVVGCRDDGFCKLAAEVSDD